MVTLILHLAFQTDVLNKTHLDATECARIVEHRHSGLVWSCRISQSIILELDRSLTNLDIRSPLLFLL
jgi:hypothetical protein